MIIYFDIETAVETNEYNGYLKKAVWESKYCKELPKGETYESMFQKNGSLHPEFAKIVCVSLGIENNGELKLKSFYGDEKAIIEQVFEALDKASSPILCGHHIKGFDIPFLYRRALINGVKPHETINVSGKKPWEINHIDTMEIWKGSGFLSTGLETIAICLGLPSPKEKMSGKDVGSVYYDNQLTEQDKQKIITEYCEGDVVTTYEVYKRISI